MIGIRSHHKITDNIYTSINKLKDYGHKLT